MRKWVRKHRRLLIVLVLLSPLLYLLIFYLSNVSVEFFLPQRLAEAQSIWASKNIKNYRIQINISKTFETFILEVHDNQITEASSRGSLQREAPFEPIENIQDRNFDYYDFKVLPRKLSEYTIDNLFDAAEKALQYVSPAHVSFCGQNNYRLTSDPDLGYMKSFAADKDNPYGYSYLLSWIPIFRCGLFQGDSEGFQIREFEVLPDPS